MKASHWIIAAVAFAFVQPAPADAAVGDPEVIIYRFSGVLDDGGVANAGVATVFHCTNFSGVQETIRFVTRRSDAEIASNGTVNIAHLATRTVVTHATLAYFTEIILETLTGSIAQGTTAIAATSINIVCTAVTIDASTTAPVGVALHGIRFAPVPGSQE